MDGDGKRQKEQFLHEKETEMMNSDEKKKKKEKNTSVTAKAYETEHSRNGERDR
jgi:hypothetical protein